MRQKSTHPTQQDVAAYAGVSLATVSRVVHNNGPVSEELRKQVNNAITAVGFKKGIFHPVNKDKDSEQKLIALIISDILNPFFPELVRGVEDEARPSGYGLLLFNTSEDPQMELKLVEQLIAWQVSGVIFCSSRVDAKNLISLCDSTQIPIVVVNRRVNHPKISSILIDFKDAAYRAAQHLLSLNHSRIAYLGGLASSETSQQRCSGVEQALAEVGLSLRQDWCLNNFPNIEGGFQGMSSLLSKSGDNQPTAVITYNDLIAIGALNAIRAFQLRIPEDISVVGFDGINITAHTNPPLTTINQPKYQMGQLAMRILQMVMQGENMPGGGYTLMESPLIIRGSTAQYHIRIPQAI